MAEMKLGKADNLLVWGMVIVGGLVAYKLFDWGKKGVAALNEFGEAAGGAVYEFFHPDTVGEMLFYTVKFPDGQFHAVPSRSVDSSGIFTNSNLSPFYAGDGKRYRIMVDKKAATAANKIAVYA
jgi:hypothetical protein